MIFGMPALIEFTSIEENAALARRLDLQFVELNMNLPYCTLEALQEADLSAIAHRYGIQFTIHADENLFFCDFNIRVADAHLQTMLDTIFLCRREHIPLINFHMSTGVYFSLPDGKHYLFQQYQDYYMQRIALFRDRCSQAAGDDVSLCIENTGLNQGFIQKGMDTLLAGPAFQLTWDIGHNYCAGTIDSPFIMAHKHRLQHMHIHGAIGKQCHLPLSSSQLDWQQALIEGQPLRAVIEVKTAQALTESVCTLRAWLNKG